MLDLSKRPVLSAGVAGFSAACLLFLLGGPALIGAPLQDLEHGIAQMRRPPRSDAAAIEAALAESAKFPLFARPTANGMPVIRLLGISRRPGGDFALLAVGSDPPKWIVEGSTINGVTLAEVQSSRIVLDAFSGQMIVGLGQSSEVTQPSEPGAVASDEIPSVRLPPEPASAPGA